jgi:Ca2+-transporting ATPase
MDSFHALKEEELLKQLKTGKTGISHEEAAKRLKQFGRNELKKIRKLDAFKILLRQFTSFLIIILIIASVISFIAGETTDAVVILVVVIINSTLGFHQEYKAERAIEKLKNMLVPKAKVMREGKVSEIDAREVVPGDILILEEGDNIMADCRILESDSLQVNEAALTGESVAEDKFPSVLKMSLVMADRTNMLYQGTEVVKGNGEAVVVSTGMKTEFGKIADMVQRMHSEPNPLKEKIDHFGKKLGFIAIALIIIITLLGVSFGFEMLIMFETAVSLAVSAIPEGLPAVITISLALATQRMLKVKSLVRKLPAAETLGRATYICTDKTGTITEEKMTVRKIFVNNEVLDKFDKKSAEFLFRIGILCNNARLEKQDNKEYVIGDPTEKALVWAAHDFGLDKKTETEKFPKVKEFPFSSDRKMMSVVRKDKGNYVSFVKGAPEIILKRCNSELINGKVKKLNEKRKQEIKARYEELASQGMRVLGFAYKTLVKSKGEIKEENSERNLIFVGFQGMIDPPRKEVKKAIEECKQAGIKVIMITGDSALTAKAVGQEVGLTGDVIEAGQLKKMSDAELSEKLKTASIFARVSPQDKLRIVEILKKNKEIVAVTGDGVNDALALKRADIGIAVGRGTDVAKDSSDMILLDNNFASIVRAVKEGRRVYDNIKKFVKYMLSANTNEIALILFVILVYQNPHLLPLLPLQILWINLVTDSLPAVALSREEAEEDVMKRQPAKENLLKGSVSFIIIAGVLAFIIAFIAFYYAWGGVDENLTKARTMAVTTSVVFQMLLVFNCRTKNLFYKFPLNKYVVYAIAVSMLLHLAVVYTPLNQFLEFAFLGLVDWAIIVGLCIVTFVALELVKLKIK